MRYNSDPPKTKQDYIDLLNEIEAYRSLDGLDFNFGAGLIKNEMQYGSEDAFYKIEANNLEETIGNWDDRKEWKDKRNRGNVKHRLHKYHRKLKEREKIKCLSKYSWDSVIERDGWKQRCYRGQRSKYLKQQSNRKIRKYKDDLPRKSNWHHKIYDYWWELY